MAGDAGQLAVGFLPALLVRVLVVVRGSREALGDDSGTRADGKHFLPSSTYNKH